ncbi:hypothetical protein [Roseateles sp.]|uniref:hypothetical protein n=1 Tax=Roseateles sp. TaxID=1971397 RepID=UPI002F42DE72
MHDHFNAWDAPDIVASPDRSASQARTVNDELSPDAGPLPDAVPAETIADMRANRRLRQVYAGKAYGLATACLLMWTLLLSAQGLIKVMTGLETWSDQVLIAVTTGVTVSVLAAFLGVIRGLFPGKDERAPAPP